MGRYGGRDSYKSGARDAKVDLFKVGQGLQHGRSERMAKEAGRDYKVFVIYKNGNSKPFGSGEWFTKEEAERKKAMWEGMNPGSKFEVRNAR